MKTVQYFTKDYLEQCRDMSAEQILKYLDDFRILASSQQSAKSKLISIKIPEDLLNSFKLKSKLHKTPYQTKIKKLMKK